MDINKVSLKKQESTGYPVIDKIIELTEPLLDSLIIRLKQDAINELKDFSSYDEEVVKLTYRYDLIKALSAYITKMDHFKFVNIQTSIDASFQISSIILRNNEEYKFNTNVIDAGGYNIQRYHYRYLIDTKLPKISNSEILQPISLEIKRLSKQEKIKNEIEYYEKLIVNCTNKIDATKKLSDDDIINQDETASRFLNTTWQDIIDRGVDGNFDYDENKFNDSQSRYRDRVIISYKQLNMFSPEIHIRDYQKQIKKLQDKFKLI